MGKVYAVRKGYKTGLFYNWDECSRQVTGYSGAEYKSFPSIDLAKKYLGMNDEIEKTKSDIKFYNDKLVDIYVDGSYKNGMYSYGFVVVKNGEVIYQSSDIGRDEGAASMNNVAGELSGAMNAIKWAFDNGLKCNIYHDYEGIGYWAKGLWKAKNSYTRAYVNFIAKYHKVVNDFIHVKGHSGNKYNEMADVLAGNAFQLY